MQKTQIQLPDELYRRAKAVAARKEISFAEVVRRGLEYITQVYPDSDVDAWTPPRLEGVDADWELLTRTDPRAVLEDELAEHQASDRSA